METLQKYFEIGVLDRLFGATIMTREAHAEANPGMDPEERDSTYRAYRAGYTK